MTKDAQKRLKVLMEYSDLGSGFQIAMSDLKIRGGGTILGASQSGHIAGIVNPPSKKKYGYYTNDEFPKSADDWLAGATEQSGSWWPVWEKWLSSRSGKMVPAREPGDKDHPPLAPAPGTYVRRKAGE